MKKATWLLALLGILSAAHSQADLLELKDGKSLSGKYLGTTAGMIRFQTTAGVQVLDPTQVVGLTLGEGNASPAPSAAPAAAAPASVTIPAGTSLLVRLVDPVSSRDSQGKRFTTTLEADLVVNGIVVARAGTKAYGRVQSAQQARRYVGQSTLDLRLTELALGPTLVPIVTTGYTDAGARSAGKTARGAAGGAAIGAIADGGQGAAKGAAIGAVASGLRKGETVTIGHGALLEFSIYQPVSVQLSR